MRKRLFKNLLHAPVTEAAPDLGSVGAELQGVIARRLGRSLAIREVDAGSCNGCELEIHALNNPRYDVERFGIRFVASPRHADALLVTGPVTLNMREALERQQSNPTFPVDFRSLGATIEFVELEPGRCYDIVDGVSVRSFLQNHGGNSYG